VKSIRPGVMAIVLDPTRQKILLHRRTDNGQWSLPGGAAEFGESVHATVHREVFEECGTTVNINRLVGVYTNPASMTFNYPDGNSVHSYSLVFECIASSDEVNNGDGKETIDVRWFNRQDCPSIVWSKLSAVVDNFLNDRFVVE